MCGEGNSVFGLLLGLFFAQLSIAALETKKRCSDAIPKKILDSSWILLVRKISDEFGQIIECLFL